MGAGTLTNQEAYKAMFYFLDELSLKFGHNAEIGGILGSMSFLNDEKPIDPTLENIWLKAINKAKNSNGNILLDIN